MAAPHEDKQQNLSREYEATTVEEAIEIALEDLRVARDKIKIQILTEGKKGLFGMEGAKKAKIRVDLLPHKPDQQP